MYIYTHTYTHIYIYIIVCNTDNWLIMFVWYSLYWENDMDSVATLNKFIHSVYPTGIVVEK